MMTCSIYSTVTVIAAPGVVTHSTRRKRPRTISSTRARVPLARIHVPCGDLAGRAGSEIDRAIVGRGIEVRVLDLEDAGANPPWAGEANGDRGQLPGWISGASAQASDAAPVAGISAFNSVTGTAWSGITATSGEFDVACEP
jgi:hypothetical protein